MMKKIFFGFTVVLLALFISTISPSLVLAQQCALDYQSCDQDHPCCNFPNFVCDGGYCVPRTILCGEPPYPCCDPPNPPCSSGYVCSGGYCSLPPTPTPTCGMHGQNCCLTPPICRISGEICISGFCYPGPTPTPTLTPAGIQPTCNGDQGIQTALGCIPVKNTTQFVAWLLEFAIGIGGGIAVLLIIIGGIQVLTSAGNPERVKAGKELITSALTGLLFIIFSLFLLQLIGVKILQIPGFGTP